VFTTTPRAAAGASGARHSLRPLFERAERAGQNSHETRGEIADVRLDVMACDKREAFAQGSETTKQSILSAARWIASLTLAMTVA
jgi:hypothetical protein